jgi:hypothetical protein
VVGLGPAIHEGIAAENLPIQGGWVCITTKSAEWHIEQMQKFVGGRAKPTVVRLNKSSCVRHGWRLSFIVMAVLVTAIHVFFRASQRRGWPGIGLRPARP